MSTTTKRLRFDQRRFPTEANGFKFMNPKPKKIPKGWVKVTRKNGRIREGDLLVFQSRLVTNRIQWAARYIGYVINPTAFETWRRPKATPSFPKTHEGKSLLDFPKQPQGGHPLALKTLPPGFTEIKGSKIIKPADLLAYHDGTFHWANGYLGLIVRDWGRVVYRHVSKL